MQLEPLKLVGEGQFNVPKAGTPSSGPSGKAEDEAIAMAKGLDLESSKTATKLKKLSRSDALDGHLHKLITCALYFVFILVGLSVLFIFIHMTNICSWMQPDQVDELTELITTGAVGGAIATIAKSRLMSDNSD